MAIEATDAPGVVPAVPPPRHRRRTGRVRRLATISSFMSPWIFGFVLFVIYPLVASLYFSFTKYNLIQPPEWVGFSNYQFMLHDPSFWQAVRNTMWIVVFAVPTQVAFAIGAAMVLTRVKRGAGAYRTIYFLPTIVPTVAGALGFLFILNPAGPVNAILAFLHLPHPLWFENPQWSKPGLLLLGIWGIGQTMIIMLAALLDVPAHLYEAADLEGAGPWQRFRYVTLPMISPVIFFAAVIGIIDGFQYFTEAYIIGGGAITSAAPVLGQPQGSLLFYSLWMYQQGWAYSHMGYAAAMAWVLFLIVLACIIVIVRTSNRWVHYQGGMR